MGILSQLNIKNSGQKYYFLLVILLSLAVCAIYLRTLGYPLFIFDDQNHYSFALNNANKSFFQLMFEKRTVMPVFYKLWSWILLIDEKYHIVFLRLINIFIHYINGILVYLIVRHYAHSALISFFTALIFFVHPMQIESVVWVSSMKGTLSSFLALSSWLIISQKKNAITYCISLLLFIMALLTKATVVFIPCAALLIELAFNRTNIKKTIYWSLPFFLLSLVFGFYQVWTYTPGIHHHILWYLTDPVKEHPLALILTLVFTAIYFYLFSKSNKKKKTYLGLGFLFVLSLLPWFFYTAISYKKTKLFLTISFYSFYKIIFPFAYSFDYGVNYPYVNGFINLAFVLSTLLTLIYSFYLLRRNNKALICLCSFIFISLPYTGLFFFTFAEISYFADRFAYLSIVPVTLLFMFLIKSKKQLIIIFSTVTFFYFSLSIRNSYLWYSSDAILRHTININRLSLSARIALSSSYEKMGNIPQAVKIIKDSITLYPNMSSLRIKVLEIYNNNKEYDKALDQGLKYLNVESKPVSQIFLHIGTSLMGKGKIEMAEEYFNRYLTINGNNKLAQEKIKQARSLHSLEKKEKKN